MKSCDFKSHCDVLRRNHGTSHQSSTKLRTEGSLSASGAAVTGQPFAQKKNVTASPTPYSETSSKSISSCCETYG